MAEMLPFELVDAFADSPFAGNPAGVVLGADELTPRQMLLIARDVNASETVFLSGLNDLHRPPRLRWFTPGVEVGFCGHATLAAAHALFERRKAALGAVANRAAEFDSPAGILTLRPEPIAGGELLWWLDMPAPQLRPERSNPMKLCELLGMTIDDTDPRVPIARTRDDDVIVLIRSFQRLNELVPRYAELRAFCEKHRIRGCLVSTLDTLSASVNVQSRFFAPAAGVPEDPVTGSVHGPLCALLAHHALVPVHDGRAALHCLQGVPGGRVGVVRAVVEQADGAARVAIAGRCHTIIRGEIRLPAVEPAA